MMEELNKQDNITEEQSHNNTDEQNNIDQNAESNNSTEETIPKFEPPVNMEALEKQKIEFNNLESQINELSDSINHDTDFRSVRKRIVALKEQVISLFLIPIVDKDRLKNRLQEIYESLSEKQNELKEELNKIYEENLNKFEPKFTQIIAEVNELPIFKEARKKLTELQNELKTIKLKQFDKDKFFNLIQENFNSINQKEVAERESYEMECSNNYLMIKPKVEQITQNVEKSDKFNDSRKKLIDLQNEIKELKLKKNNRDELFQIIRESFNSLNERQDKQREVFSKESSENYEKIVPVVNQAIEFASNPSNFSTARQTLINIQKELKELVLSKAQRDELFGKIREVFNGLNEQQDENREEFEQESNANNAKLEIKVNEALMNIEYSNDFRDIREGLLTVQDEIKILKIKRNQRNDLLAKIRKGFEKFDKKRNAYLEQKKQDKIKNLNSILENLSSKNDRLNSLITEDKDTLSNLNKQYEESKEENIKINIDDLTKKISEKEELLKSNNDRIDDIKKELESLK